MIPTKDERAALKSVVREHDILGKLEALPTVETAWLSCVRVVKSRELLIRLAVQLDDSELIMVVQKVLLKELKAVSESGRIEDVFIRELENAYVQIAGVVCGGRQ